jgi:predicted enzyme related to lactoylglutathione lyase
MKVSETFFSVDVTDMRRATAFYVEALGASVTFASDFWTSVRIAGVRLGLFLNAEHVPGRIGLHFAVGDLEAGRADVERAGGRIMGQAIEVAPGVVIIEVMDSEGNRFTLRRD